MHFNDVYVLDNLAALKTAIDLERQSCPHNFVVTMGGDFLGPSLLSSLDEGAGMVDMLSLLGVDYVCFGNHESDVTYEALCARIEQFQLSDGIWLNSNMPGFVPFLPEHHVRELLDANGELCGRSVAFVAYLIGGGRFASLYRPGSFGGADASILPVSDCHEDVVHRVRASNPGLDSVVALSHQDVPEDEELARSGLYACVLGGHDHFVHNAAVEVSGGSERSGVGHGDEHGGQHGGQHGDEHAADEDEHAAGSGRPAAARRVVPVVKAGADAAHAVVVDLVWDEGAPPASHPTSCTTRVLNIKGTPSAPSEYLPDFAAEVEVDRVTSPLRELEAATLALLPRLLNPVTGFKGYPSSEHVRVGPSSFAMYLASVLKAHTGADAALLNSGAVRGHTNYQNTDPPGMLSYAQLCQECPFPSELLVCLIDGATLAEAVQSSRALWPAPCASALQTDLGCQTDATQKLCRVDGAPLEPTRLYRVLLDSYDLQSNPVFVTYAERARREDPGRIPPLDAGRPCFVMLLDYFCRQMWRTSEGHAAHALPPMRCRRTLPGRACVSSQPAHAYVNPRPANSRPASSPSLPFP